MRIAIVQPRISYYVGGSEKVAIRHIEYLSQMGVVVDVFTTKPQGLKYSSEYTKLLGHANRNLSITEIEIPNNYKFIFNVPAGSSQDRWDAESLLFSNLVRNHLDKLNLDLVFNYYFVDILYKPLTIPNIVYLGGYPRQEIPIYRSFMKFCTATLSNSRHVFSKWEHKLIEGGVKQNFILKKGVDEFDVGSLSCPFPKNSFNIVFVGRLVQRKGVKVLISAFKKFLKIHTNVKLWVIGDGPELEVLEAQSIEVGDSINFVGQIHNVYDYMYFSDICVFPSIEGEGLMNTVCEAMMCGKCVISTKYNGNEDVILDGINGFLIEPGNENELLDKLVFLYDNPDILLTTGSSARSFAIKNLTWRSAVEDLKDKLEQIIHDYKNKL